MDLRNDAGRGHDGIVDVGLVLRDDSGSKAQTVENIVLETVSPSIRRINIGNIRLQFFDDSAHGFGLQKVQSLEFGGAIYDSVQLRCRYLDNMILVHKTWDFFRHAGPSIGKKHFRI